MQLYSASYLPLIFLTVNSGVPITVVNLEPSIMISLTVVLSTSSLVAMNHLILVTSPMAGHVNILTLDDLNERASVPGHKI